MSKSVTLLRGRLGEAVAIVASILAAFAIDAGWDGAQERREEAVALDALRSEYAYNLSRLDLVTERHESVRARIEWALRARPEEVARLTDVAAAETLYHLAFPSTFDPNLGTTTALRSSGRLSLLQDEELQGLLMSFVTAHEDMMEDRNYLGELAMDVWDEEPRLGGPWVSRDGATGVIPGLPTRGEGPAPTRADLRRVLADSILVGRVRRYQNIAGIYLSELAAQRGRLLEILDRLGAPTSSTPPDAAARRAVLLDPDHPGWSEAAPDTFDARFHTSAGPFRLRVYRDWAPVGADRFWNLARHGFYDDARLHRVVPGFITQFGISGDPEVDAVWYDRSMPDDPVVGSNVRGAVAFAFTEPGTRSTQLYVNMVDNVRLDSAGFAPIGRIVSGMQWAVDSIFGGYGEDSGGGVRRGVQAPLVEGGNAYIDAEYPELDRIWRVEVEPVGGTR